MASSALYANSTSFIAATPEGHKQLAAMYAKLDENRAVFRLALFVRGPAGPLTWGTYSEALNAAAAHRAADKYTVQYRTEGSAPDLALLHITAQYPQLRVVNAYCSMHHLTFGRTEMQNGKNRVQEINTEPDIQSFEASKLTGRLAELQQLYGFTDIGATNQR